MYRKIIGLCVFLSLLLSGQVLAGESTFYMDAITSDNPSSVLEDRLYLDEDTGFYYVEEYDGLSIVGWDLRPLDGHIDIPAIIDGKNVTSIGHYAFGFVTSGETPEHYLHQIMGTSTTRQLEGFTSLTDVTTITLPDTVTFIYDGAFSIGSNGETLSIKVEELHLPADGVGVGSEGFVGLDIEGDVSLSSIHGMTSSSFHPETSLIDDIDYEAQAEAQIVTDEEKQPSVTVQESSQVSFAIGLILAGLSIGLFTLAVVMIIRRKRKQSGSVPNNDIPVKKPVSKSSRSTRK